MPVGETGIVIYKPHLPDDQPDLPTPIIQTGNNGLKKLEYWGLLKKRLCSRTARRRWSLQQKEEIYTPITKVYEKMKTNIKQGLD